ncbi:MAG: hypothetical protein GXP06_11825 [Alphaproteobacteria bacterium]|nr:hypothetical protein [Alphaproteobacteria bacterium]
MREDNFSPDMGFIANYPLWVVFLKIRFVLWLFGFMRLLFTVIPDALRWSGMTAKESPLRPFGTPPP